MKRFCAVLAVIVLSLVMAVQVFATEATSRYGTGLIESGSRRVISVSIYGPSAGDCAMIYDALSGIDAKIKFELSIASNFSNATWPAYGATFYTGIYAVATDSDVLVSVIFDY